MNFDYSNLRDRGRSYLIDTETTYGRPAMDFLTESFKAYPMLTSTLAIFVVMSLTPVLATIALTIFVVLATIAVCLLTVAGLVLSLPVILSITLFSSAIIALLASGVLLAGKRFAQAKERTDLPDGDSTPARTEPLQAPNVRAQFHDVWGMIMHPIKSTGWKSRLVAFILFRNVLARIFLPRAVRYHPAYPLVFGRRRTPHPLKWTLVRIIAPFRMAVVIPIKLMRAPFRLISLVGLEAFLGACIILLLLSPRMRSAARRATGRMAGTGASYLVGGVKALKTSVKTALAYGKDVGRPAIAVFITALRALLEKLDERAPAEPAGVDDVSDLTAGAESTGPVSAVTSHQDAMQEYEMVSPIHGADSTSTAVSAPGESQGIRARNATGAVIGDD